MEIGSLIKEILRLNEEGIGLAGSLSTLDDAIKRHNEAVALAREAGAQINPDYHAFSVANLAYAERMKFNDRERLFGILQSTFYETERAFEGKADQTYFGRARLLEEMSLVVRSALSEPPNQDIETAIALIGRSSELYQKALGNSAANEIIDKDFMKNKLYRVTGITSVLYTLLTEISEGDKKRGYAQEAIKYAQEEISLRVNDGETSGFGLANAYHTLGVAQSELAAEEGMYQKARANLENAVELARIPEEFPAVLSVLNLRLAWLEYMAKSHRPNNKGEIQQRLEIVLNDQKNAATRWPKAFKDVLIGKMRVLAEYLGPDYSARVEQIHAMG